MALSLAELQAYGYFALTTMMVVILYSYIYHIYKAQRDGVRDYEKYSRIALEDELDDAPIEAKNNNKG